MNDNKGEEWKSSDKHNNKVDVAHWPSSDKTILVSSEGYARLIHYQKSSQLPLLLSKEKCVLLPLEING